MYMVQRAAQSQPPEERFNTVARLGFALPLCRGVEVQVQGCSPADAQTVAEDNLPRVAICAPSLGLFRLRVTWEGPAKTGTSPFEVMTCQSPLKNRPRRDPSKMVLRRHTGLVAPNGGRGLNLSPVTPLGGRALWECLAKRCGRWWMDRVADHSH